MEQQTEKQIEKPSEPIETTAKKGLVGVRFSPAGKIYTFDAQGENYVLHELIVVEGDKGPIIGKVSIPVFEKSANEVPTNIRKALHKAKDEEVERYLNNREEAMRAFNLCKEKIVKHDLDMKLVDVDVLTGDKKAIFYFTAEERVDFRSLVKDLASALHMRIEMRQIGARDATKSIGGLGSCGLTCCCETHLREFKAIAIQMAKNQGLSPNPAKLTGMCGKLKCCLLYENDMYSECKKGLPGVGAEVKTPKGDGVVNNLDIPRRLVYVYLGEKHKEIRFGVDEITILKDKEPRKKKPKKSKER